MDGTSLSIHDLTAREDTPSRHGDACHLIEIADLSKSYGDQAVLADIAFVVGQGEILGLIGPNGAGKTTLLEALAGLVPADSGSVRWRGKEIAAARRRELLFYVPDGIRPYDDQYVAQVLSFFGGVFRRSAASIGDVIAAVGLAPVVEQRVHALSKGYGRRLLLALGLLAPHELLLMDEPFDGFDLRQTREIAGVLRRDAGNGRSLFLAVHQLSDAERICDRFILLSAGRIRGYGTLDELRARTRLPGGHLEEIFLALT
jgi:ABC-2 type transport system ATP-binding protein